MTRTRLWMRIVFRQAVQARSAWFAMAVCLAIVVMVTQLYTGFLQAELARTQHLFGAQNGFFIDYGDDVYAALQSDGRIDTLGSIVVTGRATNPLSGQSEKSMLGALDDNARELAGIELQEGRWPEAQGEIVIERNTLATLRLSSQVGDMVQLAVAGTPTGSDGEPEPAVASYRLVGILNNYSYLQYHPDDLGDARPGFPSLIVAWDPAVAEAATAARFALVRVAEETLYIPFFREYAVRFGLSLDQYYLNTEAYRPDAPLEIVGGGTQSNVTSHFPHGVQTGTYRNTSGTPYQMLLLIIVLLVGLAVLLFLTTLQMLQKRQANAVFRLRTAGASPRQLAAASALQAAMSLAVLVPVGVVGGLLAALAADRWYLRDHVPYFQLVFRPVWVLTSAAGFAVLLIWRIAATSRAAHLQRPLDAGGERPADEPKRRVKKKDLPKRFPVSPDEPDARERHPLLFWAKRSFRENRMSLAGVVFLLTLGIAAVLVSTYVIAVLRLDSQYTSRHDVELSMGNGSFFSTLSIPDRQPGFAREDLVMLTQVGEIRTFRLESSFSISLVGDRTAESDRLLSSMLYFRDSEQQPFSLSDVADDKERYGYLEDEKLFLGSVTGVEPDVLESLRPYLADGDIDITALMAGRQILVVTGTAEPVARVGDPLLLTQFINPNETRMEPSAILSHGMDITGWERRDVPVTVGGIVRLPEAESDSLLNTTAERLEGSSLIVWGMDSFSLFELGERIQSVYIQMKNYRDDGDLRDAIRQLDVLYPGMQVQMRSEAERQTQVGNNIVVNVIYLMVVLLAMFAVFIIRSFSQSLAIRNRQLIGALRAGGLSLDRMRRLKALESAVLVVAACLSSHVIGLGVAVPLLVNANRIGAPISMQILDIFRFYPLVPMLVLLPVITGLVYLFQMAPIRRLYRLPVCELIREE